METKLITVPVGTPYADVMKTLRSNHVSGAPVVNEEGRLVGVVSEKDLFRILYPFYQSYYMHPEQYVNHEEREKKAGDIRKHRVEIFMSPSPFTAEPDMPIMQAGALMLSKKVHRLTVVEEDKLVGIVSRGRIYRTVMDMNYKDFIATE